MKAVFAIVLFFVCCYSFPLKEAEYQTLFTKWAVQHAKNYEMDVFFHRYSIFKQNLDYINEHNAKNTSFEMGMNSFGDLTFEEFSATYKGRPVISTHDSNTEPFVRISSHQVGAGGSLDWRTKGAVNPIQNQGQCGSCYSFSGIASVEGAIAIKKGTLVKLSEQQIVDCSRSQGNGGCEGGFEKYVFQYIMANGVGTASSYPYTGKDRQTCRATSTGATKITSFKAVTPNNEAAMLTAVNIGPISIAVCASNSFQFYTRGVFDDTRCGTSLDHAINIVGYGTDSATGKDFWLVRNSWGASWGESGYIRMVRNKNMCGLAADPIYPIA